MELARPGASLYYEFEMARGGGAPQGNAPLLIFANSLGTDLSIWGDLLALLPGNTQTLCYDKRGHGRSRFDAPFGMDELVDDAIALIEKARAQATGARPVIFVGLSIGGLIGQGVAARRPDLLDGFVLMGSAAKIGDEEFWNARISTIRKEGLAPIAAALMERWFTERFIAEGKAAPYEQMIAKCDKAGYIHCCQAIAASDFRAMTGELTLPVLALVGEADGSTPPDLVRESAASIPGARFEIIKHAAHIAPVEQPQITAQLIVDFMKGMA